MMRATPGSWFFDRRAALWRAKDQGLSPVDAIGALGERFNAYGEAILRIAPADPRLAYAMARAVYQRPQIYFLRGQFTDPTPNQPTDLAMDQTIPQDIWVEEASYNIRSPMNNQGSAIKPILDYFQAFNPQVSCRFEVAGGTFGDQYNWQISMAPLEMILPQAQGPARVYGAWPRGFFLPFTSVLQAQMMLNEAVATAQIPLNVVVSLKAMPLGCQCFNAQPYAEAIAWLRRERILLDDRPEGAQALGDSLGAMPPKPSDEG